ncbi:MAG: glycosyltransferase, partial [bacterium]
LLFVKSLAEKMRRAGLVTHYIDIEDWRRKSLWEMGKVFRRFDVIHYYQGRTKLYEFLLAKILHKRVANNFIGTEVLHLLNSTRRKKLEAKICALLADKTLSVFHPLKDELKTLGIHSELFHFSHRSLRMNVKPLPQHFTIFTYIPGDRPLFYGWDMVYRLAQKMPDTQFLIAGADSLGESWSEPSNITFLGWRDSIIPFIEKSSVVLRLARHDGLPCTVLEALSCGRQVIIRAFHFPYCYQASTYEDVKRIVLKLKENCPLNVKGAKYVVENFNDDTIVDNLLRIYRT